MPDSFACLCVECEQAVSEKIVANAIRPVEIKCRGSGRHVNDTSLRIKRHPGPAVGSAACFPCIFRPRVITELAGMRNGVEGPPQLPRPELVRTNVARRSWKCFGVASAYNDEVFINDARAR